MCLINKYTQGGALMKIAKITKYRLQKFCIMKNVGGFHKKA
jgi:hypothetical protein